VFSSNWIRDMGQFYGTNILFAESSATTGGLDSLLEPTGNIKRAQEATARAFGAKRAYFGTNGTSTSNKIVVPGGMQAGDIVIVDRNCHKSHHYGFVLSGAQPYYVEAFPADAVLDVWRGAAAHDQAGARCSARPRASSIASR
jgi:arginine decarboxylase